MKKNAKGCINHLLGFKETPSFAFLVFPLTSCSRIFFSPLWLQTFGASLNQQRICSLLAVFGLLREGR
jgi:hypothetical protein